MPSSSFPQVPLEHPHHHEHFKGVRFSLPQVKEISSQVEEGSRGTPAKSNSKRNEAPVLPLGETMQTGDTVKTG